MMTILTCNILDSWSSCTLIMCACLLGCKHVGTVKKWTCNAPSRSFHFLCECPGQPCSANLSRPPTPSCLRDMGRANLQRTLGMGAGQQYSSTFVHWVMRTRKKILSFSSGNTFCIGGWFHSGPFALESTSWYMTPLFTSCHLVTLYIIKYGHEHEAWRFTCTVMRCAVNIVYFMNEHSPG